MNIHHLELFYYVARHRGISAATRYMPYGIQQPAISGQMTQLEKSLGLTLFHRRPFGLTPAGSKLFADIEPFFGRLPDLPARIRGQADQRLRLAAPAQILRDYLPQMLAKYKRRSPEFRLTLQDVNQAGAEDLLRRREIDLAVTELEGRPAAFIDCCELVRLPLVLIVQARAKFRSLKDFLKQGRPCERLISLPPNEVLTKQFQAGLRKISISWSPSIEVSSIDLIDAYVLLGFGVGVSVALPRRPKPGLRHITLPGFQQLTVSALWTGELSDVAAAFLEDTKTVARKLAGKGGAGT